jgi:CheY-like chemotaxis protein
MTRVLIVDDEPDILLMLRINLEEAGYATTLAADGERALERVDEEHPDVMLLDVMMPVMDGWSVLEALKRRPHAPRVVVLSAKTAARDIARALRLGAVEYVTKPFEARALLATIERVLTLPADELDRRRLARIDELDGE